MLKLNNVGVIYDDVILVLKGMSMEAKEGEITVLLGANGAGKTTTLKAISGLLKSEGGRGHGRLHRIHGTEDQQPGCRRYRQDGDLPGDGGKKGFQGPDGDGKPDGRGLYPQGQAEYQKGHGHRSSIISRNCGTGAIRLRGT